MLSLWGRAQAVSQEIKKWRPASLIEKVSHVSGRLLCFTLIATEKARSKLK
ncbi:hypothetical protein MmTuc01_0300 [Methanosarcina mazei Tuc01]|uniref:Uncharacterized protein n=1 Tax=Methanosarcina mazei Tuc01 TaxID=1236903 RepID=M1QFG2_METMZ|nr:hypothetical protein MmTuc01_0300 [Methanosarcina mazei Tuc01]